MFISIYKKWQVGQQNNHSTWAKTCLKSCLKSPDIRVKTLLRSFSCSQNTKGIDGIIFDNQLVKQVAE